jgi:hypothetical protein
VFTPKVRVKLAGSASVPQLTFVAGDVEMPPIMIPPVGMSIPVSSILGEVVAVACTPVPEAVAVALSAPLSSYAVTEPTAFNDDAIVMLYTVTPEFGSIFDHIASPPHDVALFETTDANVPPPPVGVPIVRDAVPIRAITTTTLPAVTALLNVTSHELPADVI